MDNDILNDEQVILKNYLEIEVLLNEFFKEVNYCVPNCITQKNSLDFSYISGSIGCCDKNYYEIFNNFKLFEFLENERIKLYGKPKPNTQYCGYHTESGCILNSHKNPLCLLYVCSSFKNYLESVHDIQITNVIPQTVMSLLNFNSNLYRVNNIKELLKTYIDTVKTNNAELKNNSFDSININETFKTFVVNNSQ